MEQLVKLIPSVLIFNLKAPSFNLWFSPILLDLSGFCFVFFMQVLLINHHECGSEEEFITSFLSMFNFLRYTQRSLSFPIRFLEGSYIFIVSFLWLLIVVINKNKNYSLHIGLLHANQFI